MDEVGLIVVFSRKNPSEHAAKQNIFSNVHFVCTATASHKHETTQWVFVLQFSPHLTFPAVIEIPKINYKKMSFFFRMRRAMNPLLIGKNNAWHSSSSHKEATDNLVRDLRRYSGEKVVEDLEGRLSKWSVESTLR